MGYFKAGQKIHFAIKRENLQARHTCQRKENIACQVIALKVFCFPRKAMLYHKYGTETKQTLS